MPTVCPWTARVWSEFRAGNLTRAFRDVLLTLRTFRGTEGACWPSHATLADRVGCCVRTVQRALQQAQQLGLVTWSERRVKAAWRWLRTSNWYRFIVPADPLQPGQRRPRPTPLTTGHLDGGEESQGRKRALQEMLAEAAAAPDLLAMRRAAFERIQVERMLRPRTG